MIYGTCGHELKELPTTGVWWERPDGWAYGVLCDECIPKYGAQKEEPVALLTAPLVSVH